VEDSVDVEMQCETAEPSSSLRTEPWRPPLLKSTCTVAKQQQQQQQQQSMTPPLSATEQQCSAGNACLQIPCLQFDAAVPPQPARQSSVPPPNESRLDLQSPQRVISRTGLDQQLDQQQQQQQQQLQSIAGTAVGVEQSDAAAMTGSACTEKNESVCSQPTSGSVAKDDAAPAELDLDALVASFVHERSRTSLELPLGLQPEQRRRVKTMVEQHEGLRCESFGFGVERRMHIFRECATGHEPMSPVALQGVQQGAYHGANFEEFTFGSAELRGCQAAVDSTTTAGSRQIP